VRDSNRVVSAIALCVALALLSLPALPKAQIGEADLLFVANPVPQTVPAGAYFGYTLTVVNAGPSGANDVVVTAAIPAGVTAPSCTAASYHDSVVGPLLQGTCSIANGRITATLGSLGDAYDGWNPRLVIILSSMTIDAGAAAGQSFTFNFTVTSDETDPNPSNNSMSMTFITPAPLSASLSTTQLDFGPTPIRGAPGPPQSVTLTNTGKSTFGGFAPSSAGNFFAWGNSCDPSGALHGGFIIGPGSSCVFSLVFFPEVLGPQSGSVTFTLLDGYSPAITRAVNLTGLGYGLLVQQKSISFPVQPVNASASAQIFMYDFGPVPVTVSRISVTGRDFSVTHDCGVVQRGSGCGITVTFAPTVAGLRTGIVTIVDDDALSTQTVALDGNGTGIVIAGSQSGRLAFGDQVLDVTAIQSLTLTNVDNVQTVVNHITASGDGFAQKNDCPAALKPGDSCHVQAMFSPRTLGSRVGSLTIEDKATGIAQSVDLSGAGVGIGAEKHVYVHYDYMVLPDQGTSCAVDPENPPFSPDCSAGQYCVNSVCRGHSHKPPAEAIQKVVDAFDARGVKLDIDPVSKPIPEVAFMSIVERPNAYCAGVDQGLTNIAYFYDLKSAYYQPKNDRLLEHYAIFGHFSGDSHVPYCYAGGVSADIPAYDFMVTQGAHYDFQAGDIPGDFLVRLLGGTFMHELGHNLGLFHPNPNYAPNRLTLMNYSFSFGIFEADAVGSGIINPGRYVFDYSDQALPTGGNTPGRLDERDLSEPAGLGSGTAKVTMYNGTNCTFLYGPSEGAIDWDGNGVADNWHVSVNVSGSRRAYPCAPGAAVIPGFDEWDYLFHAGNNPQYPSAPFADFSAERQQTRQEPELTMDEAKKHHVLFPPRSVRLSVQGGCAVAAALTGPVQVTVFGEPDLAATDIDVVGLKLHGATPTSATLADVNGDGRLDLIVTFGAGIKLASGAKTLRLNGWLKNSQIFLGEATLGACAP